MHVWLTCRCGYFGSPPYDGHVVTNTAGAAADSYDGVFTSRSNFCRGSRRAVSIYLPASGYISPDEQTECRR